jgi:hypothetical protein
MAAVGEVVAPHMIAREGQIDLIVPGVAGGVAGLSAGDNSLAATVIIWSGTGVPSNAVGKNGDIYFRQDGGANTTMYQRRAAAYVATAA